MYATQIRKNSGFLIGPLIVCIAIAILWKNEGRFDYHLAAKATEQITDVTSTDTGQLLSYTESMNPDLVLEGGYVKSFTGYMTVKRAAEVYCWDEEEDDEGRTQWTKRWMSRVQENSRNRQIQQSLSSRTFRPPVYQIGELQIQASSVEFVDGHLKIAASQLRLSDEGHKKKLSLSKRNYYYFFLGKRGRTPIGLTIGDERVSYSGVPVPETATYFGKFDGNGGVPHQAVTRGAFLDGMINDTGVLHHIVAGNRTAALLTMKHHISQLRWRMRIAGSIAACIGFVMLFGSAVGLIYHLPVIGYFAEQGVLFLGISSGLLVSLITIAISYVLHHPIILLLTILIFVGVFFLVRTNASKSQQKLKARVDRNAGHPVDSGELSEMQFVELLRMAKVDQNIAMEERRHLKKWATQHHWSKEKVSALIKKANSTETATSASDQAGLHLRSLIRLALADGELHRYEFNAINAAAKQIGFTSSDLAKTVREVRNEA